MRRLTVDMSQWPTRNMWPLPSGEFAVRPGLRKVLSPSSVVAAQSVRAPDTGETLHYVASGTNAIIYDEAGTALQTLALGIAKKPRTATFAVNGDQIVVSSPDFATLHGYIGSGLEVARKKDSANPSTTAIAIPRGLCVAWAGRIVIADGAALYFSDPGEPRTYTGVNVVIGEWSSFIYGLHVSAEGALIVATANGLWALPEDAAAIGQVVLGQFSKLTDLVVLDYETTCTARGAVWALTRDGVRRVWPQGEELFLSELEVPRNFDARIAHDDYREGRIYGGQDGPYVAIGSSLWRRHDERGISSWWTAPNDSTFDLRGLLQTDRGEEMLLTSNAVYRMLGNFDGDESLSSEGALGVVGHFFGRVVGLEGDDDPALREARWSTNAPSRGQVSLRGSAVTVVTTPAGEQNAAIVGTSAWDDGSDYMERMLRPLSKQFDQRSHEPTLEIGAQQPGSRIDPELVLVAGGVGDKRPRHRT